MLIEELPNQLETYFRGAVKEDGSALNASTRQAYYDALWRILKFERQIDMEQDPHFLKVTQTVTRRQEVSCREGEVSTKNASRAISVEFCCS